MLTIAMAGIGALGVAEDLHLNSLSMGFRSPFRAESLEVQRLQGFSGFEAAQT